MNHTHSPIQQTALAAFQLCI